MYMYKSFVCAEYKENHLYVYSIHDFVIFFKTISESVKKIVPKRDNGSKRMQFLRYIDMIYNC